MMAGRGVRVDNATMYGGGQTFAPEMEEWLRWQWHRPASGNQRVDETTLKFAENGPITSGRWTGSATPSISIYLLPAILKQQVANLWCGHFRVEGGRQLPARNRVSQGQASKQRRSSRSRQADTTYLASAWVQNAEVRLCNDQGSCGHACSAQGQSRHLQLHE